MLRSSLIAAALVSLIAACASLTILTPRVLADTGTPTPDSTFAVLHDDHIGLLTLPAGTYTLTPFGSLTAAQATHASPRSCRTSTESCPPPGRSTPRPRPSRAGSAASRSRRPRRTRPRRPRPRAGAVRARSSSSTTTASPGFRSRPAATPSPACAAAVATTWPRSRGSSPAPTTGFPPFGSWMRRPGRSPRRSVPASGSSRFRV